MRVRRTLNLIREKRAVSAVISEMILAGAVIAVGFAVLSWASSRSNVYNQQYGSIVDSNIQVLQEKLAFEYIFYKSSSLKLTVYLMNCGMINGTSIKTVHVYNSGWAGQQWSNIILTLFPPEGRNQAFLDMGQEGYFDVTTAINLTGGSYSVRITTGRGSVFASTFVA